MLSSASSKNLRPSAKSADPPQNDENRKLSIVHSSPKETTMTRRVVRCAIALTLCSAVSIAYGAPRGKAGGRPAGERSTGERGGERKPERESGKPEGERRTGEPERKPEGNVNRKDSGEGRGAESREGGATARRGTSPGGAWGERTTLRSAFPEHTVG